MPKSELKLVYMFCAVFGILSIITSTLAFILTSLKVFPKDMQEYMDSGVLMFFYLLLTLGALILLIGVYAYKEYKKVEQKLKECDTNYGMNNGETIIWDYSDDDIKNQVKDISKDYTKKLLAVYGLLTLLFLTPKSISYFSNDMFKRIVIIYAVTFIIYLLILMYRKSALLSSQKRVIFTKEFVVYDNRTIMVDDQLGKFLGVEYDDKNNYLLFCFMDSNGSRGNRVTKFNVYVPWNRSSEVNTVLEMYNK